MSSTTKALALPALITGGLLLSACGGMVDNEQMYEEFAKTCKTSFVAEGGPAEMTEPFCTCSTDKVREQELGPTDMFDQEKMTAIGEDCMNEVLAASGVEVEPAAE